MRGWTYFLSAAIAGVLACTPVPKTDDREFTQKISELPVLGFDEVARVNGKPVRLSLYQDLRIRVPQASRDQILWVAIVAASWSTQTGEETPSSDDALALALYAVGGPWDEKAARAALSLRVQGPKPDPKTVAQRLQPFFDQAQWLKNAPLLERI